MEVRQLKKLLAEADDDMVVVLDCFDHNYRPVSYASVVEAHDQREDGYGDPPYGQYGGEDCEKDYGPKVFVFHLG